MIISKLINEKGLCCPACQAKEFSNTDGEDIVEGVIACSNCGAKYNVMHDVLSMIPEETNKSETKKDIQKFWKDLYHAAYDGHDLINDKYEFARQLTQLKDLFNVRKHLAVTEMPIEELKGKKVLEIGPGAGAHSSLFSHYGAEVTALDITLDRVFSTKSKLDLIAEDGDYLALQGDAENLPFSDCHFDIVYSNGVLHHTPDTQKAINEVYRILKPSGTAIIMLYARNSYLYWINIFLLRGVLLGNIFKGKNWLGKVTEWMSDKDQKIYNPETKVYNSREIKELFNKFETINIRKGSFVFNHFPFVGKYISKLLGMRTGFNEAGKLVYDAPWRNDSKFEVWLGKIIGFNLNIKAFKKNNN